MGLKNFSVERLCALVLINTNKMDQAEKVEQKSNSGANHLKFTGHADLNCALYRMRRRQFPYGELSPKHHLGIFTTVLPWCITLTKSYRYNSLQSLRTKK